MVDKEKAKEQLGVDYGTASGRLHRRLLFAFVQDACLDVCFRCHTKIESVRELSVEHKVPWLDSEDPKGLFFDLENIAFSHLKCNVGAARRPNKKYFTDEQKLEARRRLGAARERRRYTTEGRRAKYKRTGQ